MKINELKTELEKQTDLKFEITNTPMTSRLSCMGLPRKTLINVVMTAMNGGCIGYFIAQDTRKGWSELSYGFTADEASRVVKDVKTYANKYKGEK